MFRFAANIMLMGSSERLITHALSIKKRFLNMYFKAGAGHIGSSLSATEIVTFLFFDWMQQDDEFFLSKGHAAALLYSTLCEKGVISEEVIDTFYKDNTDLAAHPPANKIKGIPFATGSLGHGLGLAAGFALANRLKKNNKHAFCVTSDGELNEGSIWEAAMFIAHHKLTNVIWVIDKNNFQGFGSTKDVMDLGDLKQKLESFQFDCIEIDGHNFDAFYKAKAYAANCKKPVAIIANTIKGNGWETRENTLECHYLPFKDNQYTEMLQHLDEMHETRLNNTL